RGQDIGDNYNRFVTVTDVIDGGADGPIACDVLDHDANNADLTVELGKDTTVEYECIVPGEVTDFANWTNSATATWTEGDVTDNMSVSTGSVPIDAGLPSSTTYETVTVFDDE